MAHELHIEDGKAAMMYVGEVPWHGLGTPLSNPPSAEEAIKAASLDWRVVKKEIYAKDGQVWYRVPEQHALVREDLWGTERCTLFATVSDDYVPLQNSEAFSFFDKLIKRKSATYETAGALGDGERVWVLAKLGEDIDIAKDDAVQRYILLFNGHDGKTSVRVLFTPIRVVCNNTLTWALRDAETEFRAYHGPSLHKRLDELGDQLDHMLDQYNSLACSFQKMVNTPMKNGGLGKYLEFVFPTPKRRNLTEKNFEEAVQENQRRRDCSARLFEIGKGNTNSAVRGSLWAAYNGVTEWADHHANYRNRFQRFRDLFFGDVARTKTRALGGALELIGDFKTHQPPIDPSTN